MKHYPIDIPNNLHKEIKRYCKQEGFKIKEFMPYLLKTGLVFEKNIQEYSKFWIKKER